MPKQLPLEELHWRSMPLSSNVPKYTKQQGRTYLIASMESPYICTVLGYIYNRWPKYGGVLTIARARQAASMELTLRKRNHQRVMGPFCFLKRDKTVTYPTIEMGTAGSSVWPLNGGKTYLTAFDEIYGYRGKVVRPQENKGKYMSAYNSIG